MSEVQTKAKLNSQVIHALIGIAIMLIFPFIPWPWPAETVTPIGEQVLGVFIGTLYLWTTVDPLWASLLSAGAIGLTAYNPMAAVLSAWLGNPTVVQMFFMMLGIGALTYEKVTVYIGRFCLTRKIVNGRPWVFTTVILVSAYIMSVFMGCFIPIFLFWPVMYGIFNELGYKKTDKYPKLMLILIVLAALLGFPVPPYMSNGLALLSNYRTISEGNCVINDGTYFITCFIMGLVMLLVLILLTKFVLRPDVTLLKNVSVEQFKKNPLPPMNVRQKTLFVTFIIYVLLMLVPSLLQSIPFMQVLNANSIGFALLYTAILGGVVLSDDRPILQFTKIMEKDFAWSTFFLCATAILIGSVLTNETTGISAFLGRMLSPIFNGMSPYVFTIVLLLVAFVLTNVCNSLVIGMILQPVILTYATTTGVNAAPMVTLLIFFVLLSAVITPAASPFAAMMFSNKEWLKSTDVYKYAGFYAVFETILVLGLGIPFVNLMM